MGVVQKNKGGKSLRMNNLPQRILRPVREPSADGNRRERRAYDAMRREAERTNRTIDALKLILSGTSQPARRQDKRT